MLFKAWCGGTSVSRDLQFQVNLFEGIVLTKLIKRLNLTNLLDKLTRLLWNSNSTCTSEIWSYTISFSNFKKIVTCDVKLHSDKPYCWKALTAVPSNTLHNIFTRSLEICGSTKTQQKVFIADTCSVKCWRWQDGPINNSIISFIFQASLHNCTWTWVLLQQSCTDEIIFDTSKHLTEAFQAYCHAINNDTHIIMWHHSGHLNESSRLWKSVPGCFSQIQF